jgi:hypothetical protein
MSLPFRLFNRAGVRFVHLLPLQAADLALTGELKQWHKITLTVSGPQANEADSNPNPFTDLGNPPSDPSQDWLILLRKTN